MLTQGRKYKAGVVIAHQFLDQLPARTRQSLLANASIKIVGGLSYKDNLAFAHEMNTSTDFLTSLHKQESATEFGMWIKHHFVRALRLFVPFGTLEGLPRLSEGQQLALRDQNCKRYCITPQLTFDKSLHEREALPDPPREGRGGEQHKQLQQMIRALGHDFGFGVELEAPCQVSQGAIDVLLNGDQQKIAVEVSITTSPEHELANLKKCLAEELDQIWCVSPNEDHREKIHGLCMEQLPQAQIKRLAFLAPEDIHDRLALFDERETKLIRGYEVITKTVPLDPEDLAYRKLRIKQVLAAGKG